MLILVIVGRHGKTSVMQIQVRMMRMQKDVNYRLRNYEKKGAGVDLCHIREEKVLISCVDNS